MANKKNIKLFVLITGCLFLIGYITILIILSKTYNVSFEYKKFYLDHESKYYLKDNEIKENYSIGVKCNFLTSSKCKNISKEWNLEKDSGISTSSAKASLYYYNVEAKNIIFKIKFHNLYSTNINLIINNANTNITINLSSSKSNSFIIDNKYFKKDKENTISFGNVNKQYYCIEEIETSYEQNSF